MLCPYALKAFLEQLNELKLDGGVIHPWRIFQAQQHTLLLKITTPGAIQFMS